MKKLKFAVIGAGHLGRHHARIYASNPAIELAAICDIDGNKCSDLCNSFNTKYLQDYTNLKGSVDAVSIATPTQTHYQIAKYFLKNGIHTLIEKPLTKNIKEAGELVRIANKNRLILQVGHIERFNSAYIAVKRLINKPLFIECHRLSTYPNRSLDISVVLDLMIHDIDIILDLVNSEIKKIDAIGIKVLSKYEDLAHARIVFKNGTVANLTASRISDEKMRKFRIFTKSSYISINFDTQEADVFTTENKQIIRNHVSVEKEEPLKREIEAFINSIHNNCQPPVSGQEALKSLKIAARIEKQICQKRY